MSDPTLLRLLAQITDANELQRERIETTQRMYDTMHATIQTQQIRLDEQQAAIAAVQATGEKTANIIKRNLTGSDYYSSDEDELNLSDQAKFKAKSQKYKDGHRNLPAFGTNGLSPNVRTFLGMNSAKTSWLLFKEAKELFEKAVLPKEFEQLGEWMAYFADSFLDPFIKTLNSA